MTAHHGSASASENARGTAEPRKKVSFAGLLSVAAALAVLGTALGFLARFWWVFDLFSHWRAQYFIALALATALFVPLKRRRTAACCAVLAALNLFTILPLYFGGTHGDGGQTLRVTLSNVYTHRGDPVRTLEVLRELRPEIIVLLEISEQWTEALEPLHKTHPHYREVPLENNFGIGIYSVHPFLSIETLYLAQSKQPSFFAVVDTPLGPVTVIATHTLPPMSGRYSALRNAQLSDVADLAAATQGPVLLIGDLNVSPWSPYFKDLVRQSGLLDSARGNGIQPTWPTYNPAFFIPIDHCLHSPDLAVRKRFTGPATGSDHYPLSLVFTAAGGTATPQ